MFYWYNEALGQIGANDGEKPPEWELFDCREDPHEQRNLALDPQYNAVFMDMLEMLDRKMAEIGDEPRHDIAAMANDRASLLASMPL